MANPCDYGMCDPERCKEIDCTSTEESRVDTNTITLTLDGKKLMATLNLDGSIFGQIYPTREIALAKYFSEAAVLEERGVLADNSGILN